MALARKEVTDLQSELAQIRKDKAFVEEQLEDALELVDDQPNAEIIQKQHRQEIERMQLGIEKMLKIFAERVRFENEKDRLSMFTHYAKSIQITYTVL